MVDGTAKSVTVFATQRVKEMLRASAAAASILRNQFVTATPPLANQLMPIVDSMEFGQMRHAIANVTNLARMLLIARLLTPSTKPDLYVGASAHSVTKQVRVALPVLHLFSHHARASANLLA